MPDRDRLQLKRLARSLLLSIVLCMAGTAAIALIYPPIAISVLMVLVGGPHSDAELVEQQFDTRLPVFSDIVIVDRSGDATDRDDPRKLILQVVIEGYPDVSRCEGELVYFHSDPSFVSLSWSNEECQLQDSLVRAAQRQLEDDHAGAPLPARPGVVTELLKRWIERDWIVLAEIKHPEMREMVNSALEGR